MTSNSLFTENNLELWSSCLSLPNTGIIGMNHHTGCTLLLLFWGKVLLHSPDWPETHCKALAGLRLSSPPASASRYWNYSQSCTTIFGTVGLLIQIIGICAYICDSWKVGQVPEARQGKIKGAQKSEAKEQRGALMQAWAVLGGGA